MEDQSYNSYRINWGVPQGLILDPLFFFFLFFSLLLLRGPAHLQMHFSMLFTPDFEPTIWMLKQKSRPGDFLF